MQERKRHHLLRNRPEGAPGRGDDHMSLLGRERKRGKIPPGDDLA